MKERFLKIIKWFFIVLGVLFLIELLVLSGVFIGFNSYKEPDFKPLKIDMKDFEKQTVKLNEIQPVVDYVEKYRDEKGTYPDKVDVKLKKGEYKYETSENSNCFDITYTYKNSQKKYNRCKIKKDNSVSKSESYSEIKK